MKVRKALALILALVLCLSLLPMPALAADEATATNWIITEVVPCKYDEIETFGEQDDFISVKLDGKWGIIDKTGQEIIACKYDEIGTFNEQDDFISVKLDGKWGIIDKTDREIVACKYDAIHPVSSLNNNQEWISTGVLVQHNGKWGTVDLTGEIIIPCKYDSIDSYYLFYGVRIGFIPVQLDGMFGWIDRTGREVHPCEFDDVGVYSYLDDLVWGQIGSKRGYYNADGKEIIPCGKYDSVEWSGDLARVKSNGKYGFVDKTGREVISCQYEYASSPSEELIAANLYVDHILKYGYIDKTGKIVIPFKYDIAGSFTQGVASIWVDGKWGIIDKSGKELVSPKYDGIRQYRFWEGLEDIIMVYSDGKWGAIDLQGQELAACKYDELGDGLSGRGIRVAVDGKWGVLGENGREIIPCKYSRVDTTWAGEFLIVEQDGKCGVFSIYPDGELIPCVYDAVNLIHGSTAVVKNGDKWGFVVGGQEVTPCQYDYIDDRFVNIGRPMRLDGKWAFLDDAGKEIVPCKYDEVGLFDYTVELAKVRLNEKYGCIDKTGHEALSCKYDALQLDHNSGLAVVQLNGKWGIMDARTESEIIFCQYSNVMLADRYDEDDDWDGGVVAVQLDSKWGLVSIAKADLQSSLLSQSMFTVDTTAETYTGKAITKSVYGVDGDTKLVEGTDYTVTYKDNTNAGTATITVTGMGSYTGTLTYTFTIKAVSSGSSSSSPSGGGGGSSSSGGGSRPSSGGGSSSGGGGGATTPLPTQTETPASETFTDVVKGSWYESGVTYVVNKGLFKGMSEGIFSPSTNMTRAMVMTVLARLDGQDTANAVNGPWYTNVMNWAMAKGITDGTMPDSNVTREQLVTLLYRYAKPAAAAGDLTAFVDGASVSPYARDAMVWAVKQGILTGKDGARLDPQGTATRAEVATIFQRFVENK